MLLRTPAIASQNGDTGFSCGWTATTGTSTISSPGLTYGSLNVIGNHATTPVQNTTFSRSLLTTLGSSTSTYYFSFILRPENSSSSNGAEFALTGSTASLYVGFSFDELRIGTSYADVASAVPESGTWMAGFALAGVTAAGWFRTRKPHEAVSGTA